MTDLLLVQKHQHHTLHYIHFYNMFTPLELASSKINLSKHHEKFEIHSPLTYGHRICIVQVKKG